MEPLLNATAEYYDSSFKSKDRSEHNWDFLLSGASAYFLKKDFGCAKVLAEKVIGLIEIQHSPQNLLTNIFNYFLNGMYLQYIKVKDSYDQINNYFLDYFEKGKSLEILKDALYEYRKEIYKDEDLDSIFYVDIY